MNFSDSDSDFDSTHESDVQRLESEVASNFQKYFHLGSTHSNLCQQKCIVAVSGGPDSVALLHLLKHLSPELKLVVAHMNHHARSGADADEAFVSQLAAKLNLDLEVVHWQATRQSHFEADARKARHDWLERLAVQHFASYIVTAHTMDDQAETLLMRMIRGTGPLGLSGIRHVRPLGDPQVSIIRPLLGVSKMRLLMYLESVGLTYCTDPTNQDTEHQSRAWVRHVLIPQIEQRLNPSFKRSLSQLAELSAEEQDGLDTLARQTFSDSARVDPDQQSITIDVHKFELAGPDWLRRRWLRLAWSELNWPLRKLTMHHWLELEKHITDPSDKADDRLQMPGFILVQRVSGKTLIRKENPQLLNSRDVTPDEPVNNDSCMKWPWPGEVEVDGWKISAVVQPHSLSPDLIKQINPRNEAVVDSHNLIPPIYLRHPLPGDQFDPLGLAGHEQKIVDFLRTQNVPASKKPKVWLACDQQGIFWVVGHRIAERVKCLPDSQDLWHLTCTQQSS